MTTWSPPSPEPPPLVGRAQALAREHGFLKSCVPEVGALLHVLAAQRGRTRVGEIGTGTGVGAAWIVSALPPGVPFVTVELDERRAAAAAELFADDPQVRVVKGDWHEVMPAEAPFDLLFYDGGGKQRPDLDGEDVVALLAPGGMVVMDDLTPGPAGTGPGPRILARPPPARGGRGLRLADDCGDRGRRGEVGKGREPLCR